MYLTSPEMGYTNVSCKTVAPVPGVNPPMFQVSLCSTVNGACYYTWSGPYSGSTDTSCAAMPDNNAGTAQALDRGSAQSVQMCDTSSGYGAGSGSGCVAQFHPGIGIASSQGGFVFAGSWKTTGTGCTPNPDGTFTPDGSSLPQASPKGPTGPSSRSCGGGSCVDPSTGQACVVTQSGQQFCTPTGAAFPPSQSNCYSDGSSTTLCIGVPNPTTPPNPPVTDPATQITSHDTYNVSNTNNQSTTTVNVYNTTGGATSSGQKPGDVGPSNGGGPKGTDPAHASSAGGNGTLSGGTDCSSPPVCTGDSVLCGIARTQWSTTCQVHKDLVGTTSPPSATAPTQGDVWGDGTNTGNARGDAANQGNYDTTGFGFARDCPLTDLTVQVMGKSVAIPFSKGCMIGGWVRAILLAFAAFAAVRITAGGIR